jgi:hypothetical protein
MRRLSKVQFNRAIEGKSVMTAEADTPTSAPNKSKRASRMIATALVVVVGIGAGWIGGKVLSRRMSSSPAAAPASDASAGDPSTALSLPSPQSQPPTKRTSAVAASPSEPTPESEQPVVASEPRPKEPEPREAPPKTPKVEKEDGPDTPTAEDPAKEIGRQAVKKMSKEVKRMKRGLANKNENEDRH